MPDSLLTLMLDNVTPQPSKPQYSTKVESCLDAVFERERDLGSLELVHLAMACLDQAGLSRKAQVEIFGLISNAVPEYQP